MTRTGRAALHFATALFVNITPVIGFVTTPVILRHLGQERLGAFRATSDWVSQLGLLDLGLSTALSSLLAQASARGDEPRQGEVLILGIRAYAVILAAMLTLGAAATFALPRLIPVRPELLGDLRYAWFICLLGLTSLPLAPFRVYTEARQLGYRTNLLSGLQAVLTAAFCVAAALSSFGISGQALAVAVGSLVLPLSLAAFAWPSRSGFGKDVLFRRIPASSWRTLWSLNVSALLLSISGRLSLTIDGILVTYVLGPAAMVPVFITTRLVGVVQAPVFAIGNASWAGLAELYGRGEHETVRQRLIELTRLSAILAVSALLPVVIYNHTFVALWVGEENWGGEFLTILGAVSTFLLCMFSLWGWLFTAAGELKAVVRVAVTSAVVNVAGSVFFTYRLGRVGPVLGSVVAFVLVHLTGLPSAMRKVFGISPVKLLRATMMPVVLGAAWSVGPSLGNRFLSPHGWFGLGLHMFVAATGYLILAWNFLQDDAARAVWRRRFISSGIAKRLHLAARRD